MKCSSKIYLEYFLLHEEKKETYFNIYLNKVKLMTTIK